MQGDNTEATAENTGKSTDRRNANLKPWKPGESGNPAGRPPKGYSITEMMKDLLSKKIRGKAGGMVDPREAIAISIIDKALRGDTAAQKLIWQYMDGMPVQPNVELPPDVIDQFLHIYTPEKNK